MDHSASLVLLDIFLFPLRRIYHDVLLKIRRFQLGLLDLALSLVQSMRMRSSCLSLRELLRRYDSVVQSVAEAELLKTHTISLYLYPYPKSTFNII